MKILFITFGFFIIMFALMAIGYIIKRKVIQGSCGGLDAMGIEKACECPEPCEDRIKREYKIKKLEERQEKWNKQRII